jgi:hypothetical protein
MLVVEVADREWALPPVAQVAVVLEVILLPTEVLVQQILAVVVVVVIPLVMAVQAALAS